MKKIIFIFICFTFLCLNVNAEERTINYEVIPNVFSNYNIDGVQYSVPLVHIYDDLGNRLYCIQRGIPLIASNYVASEDFQISNIVFELKNHLELISYYGYGYEEDYSLYQYMATQELIWLYLGMDVLWSTEADSNGQIIDVTENKNNIMNNVNRHSLNPQFNEGYVEARVGTERIIYDENGVLIDYFVYNDSGNIVEQHQNSLTFSFYKMGNNSLTLKRQVEDRGTTKVYISEGSQMLMYFGNFISEDTVLYYNVYGGNIFIQKIDYDTNTNVPSGEASLQSGAYSIYDIYGNLVGTALTDENGVYSLNGLELGTYIIKELYPSMGYLPSIQDYSVTLSFGDSVKTITIPCEVLKKRLEIVNYYENDVLVPAVGNNFGIYTLQGIYLYTIITDENGYAHIDLPYGSYKIKQMTVSEGYELAEDFTLIIDFIDTQTSFQIINRRITSNDPTEQEGEEENNGNEAETNEPGQENNNNDEETTNEPGQENNNEENPTENNTEQEENNEEEISEDSSTEDNEEEILPDLYVDSNYFLYMIGAIICIKKLLH